MEKINELYKSLRFVNEAYELLEEAECFSKYDGLIDEKFTEVFSTIAELQGLIEDCIEDTEEQLESEDLEEDD